MVIIGEHAEVDVKSAEKETQPPKAFTEGTLLTAMKTANKTVDDEEAIKILQEVEGIGTEATRASIMKCSPKVGQKLCGKAILNSVLDRT